MDTPETPKEAAKDAKESAKDAKESAQDAKDSAKDAKDAASSAKKLAAESAARARMFAVEFRDFLLKSNMLTLALAVVLGTAVNKVVQAIVTTLIMPIAGVFSASGNWSSALHLKVWRFNFPIGELLAVLLDFAIVACVVFLITKAFIKSAPAVPTKTCKMCLEAIHQDAKRCKFCTSEA